MRKALAALGFCTVAGAGFLPHSAPPAAIQFELVDHILIPARINDSANALLVYDPVQGLMLDNAFVRRSGLRSFSGEEMGFGTVRAGGAGSRDYDVSFVRDATIRVGARQLAAPVVPVIPLDSVMSQAIGRQVDGLFGVDLLGSSIVQFDFAQRRLVLHDASSFRVPAGYQTLPVRRHGARAAVPLTIILTPADTVRGMFVLDFGMGGSLRLTTHFVDSLNLTSRVGPTVASNSETGLGGSLSSLFTRVASVRLGNTVFSDVVVSLARETSGGDAHPPYDGLIGLEMLRRVDMLYHHDASRFWVRSTPRTREPFVFVESGVTLFPAVDGAPLRVSRVGAGSAAQRAGLSRGDVIETVDGKSTIGWTKRTFTDALRAKVGARVMLQIVRANGSRASTTMELADALPREKR